MKKTLERNRDGLIVIDGASIEIKDSQALRKALYFHYNEKFFNKFLNKFSFEGLSYQQVNWIMRKFWSLGSVGCFIRKDWKYLEKDEDFAKHPEDKIVFAPWVLNDKINIYDFPNKVTFVNTRGVDFIPTTPFDLDKNAVIGYIQRNKKSVLSSIKVKIAQLVDVEMTLHTNQKTQKYPWIVSVSPEDEKQVKNLFDNIDDDNPYLFAGISDLKNAKALVSGAPYILDKLYQLKQAIENEILTILGVNNIGMLEKKEHAIVDEVNANNQEIQESGNQFYDMLKEFFERVKDVLGYEVKVTMKEAEMNAFSEEKDFEEDKDNDEGNE